MQSALMESEELLYNDGYSHIAGNEEGDITIVEFYDYNCGYCKQVPEHIAQLIEEDKNVKKLYSKNYRFLPNLHNLLLLLPWHP